MEKLDYARLWKTLMRTGIKDRFSQIRREFFMKIATDGAAIYKTAEDRNRIIESSEVFDNSPELIKYLDLAIPLGDEFKHHRYETLDGELFIEYFANVSSGLPKEYIDFVIPNNVETDYNIDANCTSVYIEKPINVNSETQEESTIKITNHLIIVGEGGHKIEPDDYPVIIKHELTHACLYELRKWISDGYFKSMTVPATWTDADIEKWDLDIKYLADVLDDKNKESDDFIEFICEFLMYESDGVLKVKNQIGSSKDSKASSKSSSKAQKETKSSKPTYRIITPFEVFLDVIDTMEPDYGKLYLPILKELGPLYDDYDSFLDEIRM